MHKKFTFYFPYRGVGGVPVLFLRVAEKLIEMGHRCAVVDYEDGYMAKNKKEGIELIKYNDSQIEIPEECTLIFQSDLPWGIPRQIKTHPNTTLFFWNCYPYNLIPVFPAPLSHFVSARLGLVKLSLLTILAQARNHTLQFLKLMIQTDAIVFMDEANRQTSEYALSFSQIPRKYLPVLVTPRTSEKLKPTELISQESLTLAWIGRVADFKINSLYRVIEDVNKAQISVPVKMIIVGNGQYLEELKAFCSTQKKIAFEFIDSLRSEDIPLFLNQRVDLLFAMGTSALEGGLSHTPTVLLDFSYAKIKSGYTYKFLNQTKDYNLGTPISSVHYLGSNIELLLNQVLTDKDRIARECHSYVLMNHSIDTKISDFINLSQNSRLKYQDLMDESFLKKPLLYRLRAGLFKYFK